MAFIPAPQIVMAEVRATLDGQQIENRIMIDLLTPVVPSLVTSVANIVNNWAQSSYFDQLPSAVELRSVVATDMSAADGSQHTISPVSTFVGALPDPPLPNEVSFCLSLRTASRGRSARGRFYTLALQKTDVTGNNLSSTRAGLLVASFNALIADIVDTDWSPVIVSYISGGAPRVGGPVYYPIVNATAVDLVVDSQRRRRPGIGS